ncbi:phytase Pho112p [Diutina catenulata]
MVALSKIVGLQFINPNAFNDVHTPDQASLEQFRLQTYLGGSAPYVQHPGFGLSPDTPQGCSVEQVQLLSRHGERYPTVSKGKKMRKLHKKLSEAKWEGDLSFLNSLGYFVSDDKYLGKETDPENAKGPYTGIANLELHGEAFRKRYADLYDPNGDAFPVFTSNGDRVFHSAEAFARGFLNGTREAKFVVLGEDKSMGLNSLTPRHGCKEYNEDTEETAKKYDDSYLDGLVERLSPAKIDKKDAFLLFDYCAYEFNVRGNSPICQIPLLEEYVAYSYSKDLTKYYSSGPGNPWAKTVGSVTLKALVELFESPEKIWLSFTHDTDLDHFLSALGLVTPEKDLDPSEIDFTRAYNHAYVVPQGARIYTEKLKCGNDEYVRFVLNDAVYPLRGCTSGPGMSCKMEDFKDIVSKLDHNIAEKCKVPSDAPQNLTFYWDWQSKDYNAPLEI